MARHRSKKNQKGKNAGINIAYQNKDIVSKLFGEQMVGKPLSLPGLSPGIKVVGIRPTNIPLLEVKELRMDNLFELEDGSLAVVDYESTYTEENFVKYGYYILSVYKRCLKSGQSPDIRMIVIYTADITEAEGTVRKTACEIHTEPVFLVDVDSETWEKEVEDAIASQDVTDEVLMHLIFLPLTYKGKAGKEAAIERCIGLARQIPDEGQTRFALAGIMAFTDKVISNQARNHIKEVLEMTKIGKMIYDDGKKEGKIEGKIEGKFEGTIETLHSLEQDGTITVECAASKVNVTVEEFRKKVQALGIA